jgi:hypothetical protein
MKNEVLYVLRFKSDSETCPGWYILQRETFDRPVKGLRWATLFKDRSNAKKIQETSSWDLEIVPVSLTLLELRKPSP